MKLSMMTMIIGTSAVTDCLIEELMSQAHITVNVKRIEEIFQKASKRIDALKTGERLPVTALAADLGKEYDLSGAQLYPIISLLMYEYPGFTVYRGAKGGIGRIVNAKVEPIADNKLSEESSPDVSDELSEDKTLPIINT